MKKLRLLIIFVIAVCCLSMLSACEKLPTLQAPTRVQVEMTTLTLSWREIRDARLYTVSIQPEEGEAKEYLVSKATYALAFLEEGTYTIRVKANGKEEEIEDSAWSEPLTFVREREPGLVMTLSKDGTSYEVTDKGIATGHIVIPDTYRGKPVTSIGKKAFFNKPDVTGITFGKNIESIGEFAFANCSYLTELVLPENLKTLGASAFASCRLLSGELVLPEGLEEIPEKAFAYCGSLGSVRFGSKVHSVGPYAFTECTALTSVQLPDSLLYIYDYAFAGCKGVTEVSFGSNVEAIGPYAFAELLEMTSVRMPDSVKTIGEGAFTLCAKLQDVTLSANLEMIDNGAFDSTALWENAAGPEVYVGQWFLGLKSATEVLNLRADTIGMANFCLFGNQTLTGNIVLPNSVKIIGNAAFANSGVVNVVLGNGVETIGEQAFALCENLTTMALGAYDFDEGKLADSSLKNIGNYAFNGCTSLKEIEIPESVTVIGSYAFKDTGIWKAITEDGVIYAGNWVVGFSDTLSGNVTLKNGTVGISNYAFYQCTGLTGIRMPNTVKQVGRAAFYKCTKLTSVTLPNMLEVIEDYTFYHCDMLQLFELPPVLRSIGRSAFYKCGSVAQQTGSEEETTNRTDEVFTIPSAVTTIGDYAFYGCGYEGSDDNGNKVAYGIDIVIIGDSVEHIGANAFYNFVSMRELVLGNGLTSMGDKAFQKCTSLQKVTFGSSLQTIGVKAFYKCEALEHVSLPDNITHVGDYAFYGCEGLRVLEMGNGVTSIGKSAFYGCTNLGQLQVSTSLQEIGKQAFRNCYSLTAVVLHRDIQSIQPHAFYGCNQLTLYAEVASAGENWDRFWNSSYRPVVWECTLSEGRDYVVSFNKSATSIDNKNATNTLSLPTRVGYTCIGWHTNAAATEAAYDCVTIVDVTDGRKLYAIWVEAE